MDSFIDSLFCFPGFIDARYELTRMQIQTNGNLLGIYTTPDHVFQMGAVGYFG